jgi:hypothetical protein
MARVADFLRLALQHPERAAETSQAVKKFRQDFQRVQYGFSAYV